MALAEAQAAKDRDTLAALVRDGHVIRRGPGSAFVRDITGRAWPKHPSVITGGKINLAIRPKRKKGHR
jgi:hypothetical protein